MSLAAWALAVALFGAVGTVLNMFASWANYRRVKPRVVMRMNSYLDLAPDPPCVRLSIRFVNTRTTPIRVEKVFLSQWSHEDRRSHRTVLTVTKGEEANEVPALDGLLWEVTIPLDHYRPDVKVFLTAQLSNGTYTSPNWFDRRNMRHALKMLGYHHGLKERNASILASMRAAGKYQLSFDDIED